MPEPVVEKLELEEAEESKATEDTKKAGRSFHHNSQKHTVITIKHMVSLRELQATTEAHEIAMKMWNLFIKGNKKTKEVLSVLFGSIDMGNEKDLKLFETYGFSSILKYPMAEIRKAQDILREVTVQQMTPSKV